MLASGILEAHESPRLGHKCLFADRLDDAAGSPPTLVPFGHILYQNRNRTLHPGLGRFVQRDPNATAATLMSAALMHGRGAGAVALAFDVESLYGDSFNLYSYLRSNPYGNSDPLGLSSDPFDIVDEYLAERAGAAASTLDALGQGAKATAVVAAQIMTLLPFPAAGIAGELALVALGKQSMDAAMMGIAMGIVPGGKLLGTLGRFIGRIGASAWNAAKHYARKGASFLWRYSTLGLVRRGLKWLRRKPGLACGCFAAGTVVWTAHGTVPIESVLTGESVLCADEASGSIVLREVVDEIVTLDGALVDLHLVHADGVFETLRTTDEHPFWVKGKGWSRADELAPGDMLRTALGGGALVEAIVFTDERTIVYNLSVADNPNYLVGAHGVWAHNCRFAIRNKHLAGKTHPVTGVPFDRNGYPDSSQWRKGEPVQLPNGHQGRRADFREANALAGYDKTPEGYTWHHHQDGFSMELVDAQVHARTAHTGSTPGP